jgi:hypothetical protein
MTDSNATEILSELSALKTFFNAARDALAQSKVVDMSGIDVRISKVCQTVQKAQAEDQAACLPELTNLIDLLNKYEQDLRVFQTAQLAEAAKLTEQDK